MPTLYVHKTASNSIGIYVPDEHRPTIVSALDVLAEAPEHLKLVEDAVRNIRMSYSFSHPDTHNSRAYISQKTVKRGRVPTLVDIVHEAKHIDLHNKGFTYSRHDEEVICFATEAECLEVLGERYQRELNLGFEFNSDAYMGLRRIQKKLMEHM